jgi:hypothetical protein
MFDAGACSHQRTEDDAGQRQQISNAPSNIRICDSSAKANKNSLLRKVYILFYK